MELPAIHCLNCGDLLDKAHSIDDGRDFPLPGDYTACLHCGHLMVYADDLTVRAPTGPEIVAIAGDPQLQQLSEIVRLYQLTKDSQDG